MVNKNGKLTDFFTVLVLVNEKGSTPIHVSSHT